eukprot:gene58878-80632_t
MAAPHVVGALAPLKTKFPSDTPRQLINRLLRSVDPLPILAGKAQTRGRLNVARALASTDNRPFNDDFAARALLSNDNVFARASSVGAPISLAVDAVGGETFSRMVECLTTGGTIVAYGSLSMQLPQLNSVAVIFNDVRVRGFWLSRWFQTASGPEKQAAYGQVIQSVASGALKARIDSRFALDDIAAAVTRALSLNIIIMKGIIGKKIGMTSIFEPNGKQT